MADNIKTSIIFYSGACHTSFHIAPIVPLFAKTGYNFIGRPLPSAGNPNSTTEENIASIQDIVQQELSGGQSVVLVLHSAAGPIGCESVNRILAKDPSARLRFQIIFVGSFIDRDPVIARLVAENHSRSEQIGNATISYSNKPYETIFNDMTTEEAKPFVEALTCQASLEDVDFSSDLWEGLPLKYLCCERDMTVLPEVQRGEAEKYGMHMEGIDAGHDPFVSCPEKFVNVICKMIESQDPAK